MKKYSVIIFLFANSCTPDYYRRIVFTHYSSNVNKQEKIKYSAEIPKGYTLKIYSASGETGMENQYLYPDSSMFYISDFGSTINEQNIQNEGYASKKFEYSMQVVGLTNDTLILSGRNQSGAYWKEVLIGKVSIGYLNVSKEKKDFFDKAIETFESH